MITVNKVLYIGEMIGTISQIVEIVPIQAIKLFFY